MRTSETSAITLQKVGGVAALYLAAAYLAAMPIFYFAGDLDEQTPAEKVTMLATHRWAMQAAYLATYVVFGIVLAVLAVALHDRLRTAAPVLGRIAAVVGVLWGTALLASGLIFNAGMGAVVDIYPTDPGRATSLWQAIEPVTQGLGGADGELLGGLWVLLVTIAGLRGVLPRRLGWLGLVVGIAGLISVIPPLQSAVYVFGLLQLVWFPWLGISLLRTSRQPMPRVVEPITV
ncbi:MAG: DUF4386 family protein [Kineosporiaceae bacterium]|nr:DUF4386 family protein [Kineosporiaceae bacterium]MBK7622607.1 DUF4386 family protein [Kineosporiaceae bacterium]MBK8078588.1 DUF4386 family protein [Kineosporiaceae bacterium]